ncbi:MAG: DUF6794 domain-containing protein [Candidatus Paceibacterota bacterium]|jgi:hypothetical protein
MTNEEKQPQSVEEAVDILHANMGLNDEILLATMLEENLVDVHFALGYHIRHEFGLWTGNDALLESCRIISGDKNLHVDDASMLIVKALWEKVKEKNVLQD